MKLGTGLTRDKPDQSAREVTQGPKQTMAKLTSSADLVSNAGGGSWNQPRACVAGKHFSHVNLWPELSSNITSSSRFEIPYVPEPAASS